MSEEEKERIERLKKWRDNMLKGTRANVIHNFCNDIDILLNLLERQQKELEQEKEKNGILQEELNNKIKALDIAMSNPDYISKDKIREILNKYDEQSKVKNIYWYEIEKDLQELLQEGDDK